VSPDLTLEYSELSPHTILYAIHIIITINSDYFSK